MLKWASYSKKVNIATQLNSHLYEQQERKRAMLMKMLSSMRFLARQGLPVCVRRRSDDTGNYRELLKLRTDNIKYTQSWFTRKQRYFSYDVQNEMLNLMSQHVLHSLLADIKKHDFFSLICDEVTDEVRQQHLGISVRWVDAEFSIYKDFLGLYAISKADAETLTNLIQDALLVC